VFVLSEKTQRLIRGPLYEMIFPLLDGTRTADDLVDAVDAPAHETYYALLILEQKGYVIDADDPRPRANGGFWSLYDIDSRRVAQTLECARVSIRALGVDLDTESLKSSLRSVGIETGDEGNVTVVLVDDYLCPMLREINSSAIARCRRWVLAKPIGSTPWIGPLFDPAQTACWTCLAHRQRQHQALEQFVTGRAETGLGLPPCDTPLIRRVAYDILAMEILKALGAPEHCAIVGRVLSLDPRTWRTESHVVVRRPQCPTCGLDDFRHPREAARVTLAGCRRLVLADGGYRSVTPEETIERHAHHVSPITGVVEVLERQPMATKAMRAYVAGHNLVASDSRGTSRTLRNYSGGKGTTDAQAKASALCEALERYSGVYEGYEPQVVASFEQLSPAAIHPNACMLYSDEQYRHRDEWNARGSKCTRVPPRFDETVQLRWSPVWSLSRQEFRYLPTSYCYYGCRDFPDNPGMSGFCNPCSNGNAAGNTLEEAILQGLLELIERDAVAIWWYNRLRRPEFGLESLHEPYIAELAEQYEDLGRRLWLLDITSDLEVPVFAAVSSRCDGTAPILLGFGCHVESRLAALRALTEMNQLCLAALGLDRERSDSPAADEETRNWLERASLAEHEYLVADPAAGPVRASDHQSPPFEDIRDAVRSCQSTVEKRGLEVLVLDQTRPDIGLPVAKVIVPGLRHFWPRYAPGRLYDVPKEMSWVASARAEADLNPVSIFF
jgi:ribosomal protein S12 methylthiotransferase accessory factor